VSNLSEIPAEFEFAHRWRRVLKMPMFLGMAAIVAGVVYKNLWLWAGIFIAIPSAYLMNLKCYKCFWTACRQFGRGKFGQDAMLAPLVSPFLFPSACTKCGAPFAAAKEENAQTH